MVFGLSKLLNPKHLSIVVNTADDQEIFGLHVSPDLDTVMYTLAGINNKSTGWGIDGDTFNTQSMLKKYIPDLWFNIGDKDMATHIYRSKFMSNNSKLSTITSKLSKLLKVPQKIIPMTDDRVRTKLTTNIGILDFQEYFVKHKCDPIVKSISFEGIEKATPSAEFVRSVNKSDALIICPSNPFLSVAPILNLPGISTTLRNLKVPRIAISPIVGGKSIRGPAGKIMSELNLTVSCTEVAKEYIGLCDVFVIDENDRDQVNKIRSLGIDVEVRKTIMDSEQDKINLANMILEIINDRQF